MASEWDEFFNRELPEPEGVRCPDCKGWGDDGYFQYCENCGGIGRVYEESND